MKMPTMIFLTMLAGWINRKQQDVIEYLLEENWVLKECMGKKRIKLNDDQRKRLALRGKKLGWSALNAVAHIWRPEEP